MGWTASSRVPITWRRFERNGFQLFVRLWLFLGENGGAFVWIVCGKARRDSVWRWKWLRETSFKWVQQLTHIITICWGKKNRKYTINCNELRRQFLKARTKEKCLREWGNITNDKQVRRVGDMGCDGEGGRSQYQELIHKDKIPNPSPSVVIYYFLLNLDAVFTSMTSVGPPTPSVAISRLALWGPRQFINNYALLFIIPI